jgi:AbrB family looped-hinge helix DNA binding protein
MEVPVETVTVSSKYQVVIPRSVRERLGIQPGQQVQVIPYADRIEVVPLRPARELRGFLSDLENTFEREGDRL